MKLYRSSVRLVDRRDVPALLIVPLISVWLGGARVVSGGDDHAVPSDGQVLSLSDLPGETREGIESAMRLARSVGGSPELVFHDPTERVTVTVGESERLIEGRDGAVVGFREAALGRVGGLVLLSDAVPIGVGESVARSERRAGSVKVEEWWRNGAAGIEQGFTVRSRPDGTGPLHLRQRISSALTAELVDGGRGVSFLDANGERLRFDGLVAFDATGRHLPATMSLSVDLLTFKVDDTDAVFPIVIDPVWSQQAYLKASNSAADDEFGRSVAVSGDTVVVGAPYEDSNATGVNGDELSNSATGSGAVYVFTRSGSVWSQQAYLKASNASVGDTFGWSVAIDGDTLVVGAPFEDSNATGTNGDESNNSVTNAGAAYVFTRTETTWAQQAYLKASNPDVEDYFGFDVQVSDDTIVVGAPYEDSNATVVNGNESDDSVMNAGAAYVFFRLGSMWSQQAYLKASNTGLGDNFGWSVAASGDTVAVGAWSEDGPGDATSGSGAAYVFTRSGTVWSQEADLRASNSATGDRFGYSVSISGDTLAVGAPLEDSNARGSNGAEIDDSATDSGAAYVFTRSGTTWAQQAYLKASNTGDFDQFGASVSLSDDALAVGAPAESSNATGVNGDGSDDSRSDSGAVYAFTLSGTVWSQEAYLKASNTGADDALGSDVGASGGTVVAGAYYEDGSSSGVDGADDDLTRDTGAAYVWLGAPPTYTLTYAATGADSGAAPASRSGNGLLSLDGNTGNLVKEGHTFVGWAASAGQSTAISGSYNLAADVTLHPVWLVNSYTVTFEENGGSEVADGSFTHGGSLTFPADPTRQGYAFLGWFAAAAGGSSLTASTVVAGNASVTLYAQWSEVESPATSVPSTDPVETVPEENETSAPPSSSVGPGELPADEPVVLPLTGSRTDLLVLCASILLLLGVMASGRRRPA